MIYKFQKTQEYKYISYFSDNLKCQKFIAYSFDQALTINEDQMFLLRQNAEKIDKSMPAV